MVLTVQYDPHLGLEVLIGELPQGEGLPGCVLQQAEGDADGVFWREAGRVDEPAGGGKDGQVLLLLQNQKQQYRQYRNQNMCIVSYRTVRIVLVSFRIISNIVHRIVHRIILHQIVPFHIINVDMSGEVMLMLSETSPHLVLWVSWVSLYRT